MADEVVQIVNVMDGLNRFRFAKEGELLAAWESASNVLAAPRNGSAKSASAAFTFAGSGRVTLRSRGGHGPGRDYANVT